MKPFLNTALFFALALGLSPLCLAQMSVEINGPTTINTNNQILYTVDFYDNGYQIVPPTSGLAFWDNSGATVVYESDLEYRLNYTVPGTSHWVYYEYSTFDDYFSDILYITVEGTSCSGITPSADDVQRAGSGSVTLVADPAPSGFTYQWYNSTGTTLLSGNQSFTSPSLSTTTTYKLAYKHTSSGCITDKVDVQAIVTVEVVESDYNYVKRYAALTATSSTSTVKTGANTVSAKDFTYFDGLGRPMQQVQKQASALGRDIIVPITYDAYGRRDLAYLPYSRDNGSESGNYREGALAEQDAFYDSQFGGNAGSYAFSQSVYESSPLNRVVETYAPGDPWAKASSGGGKPVETAYLGNDSNDKVILWEILEGQLIAQRFYGAGTLYKTLTTDEEGHQMAEFKDLQGRTVLKEVQAPGGKWARTYYVFDDFGNLIYVLPPEAAGEYESVDLVQPVGYYLVTDDQDYSAISGTSGGKVAYLPTGSVTVSPGTTLGNGVHIKPHGIMPTQDFLNQWAFQYKYDERQRMKEKKVPGANLVYLVYDKLDRLVLTQDGNQRASNKWTFTKYDIHDRPVITGEKVITGSLSSIRNNVKNHSVLYETYTGSGVTKYSGNAYPTSVAESEIHTITYYDNYNFTTKTFSLPTELNSSAGGKIIPDDFAAVRGQVTGTKVKVLGTTNDYIETVNFYDDRYRLIQSKVVNYKDGEDVVSTQYDFAGRVRKTHLEHHNPAADIGAAEVTQEYAYDHAGRLLTVTHSMGGATPVTLLSNTYNELGELVNKELADGYEDIDYAYTMRGWLSRINNLSDGTQKLFEMDLEYDDAPSGHQAYNGNIGATAWKNPYETLVNRYDYNYDEMNRLTAADYSNGGASSMGFDVTGLSYDLNGNIQGLQRKGNDENDNANVTIDNLSYTYAKGNQLSKVADSSGKTAGFQDGTNQTTEYVYDKNGNMIEDRNKGITAITYNHLNLPELVTFSASKYIEYTYDASGAKLSQKVVDGGSTKVSDYMGGFIYEDNQLQFLQHEEGRVVAKRDDTGTFDGFQYQYHLKDHLGNVRTTFKTEQEDPDVYRATLENDTPTKDYEQEYFSRYGEVTRINADIFDHTDAGSSKTYSMRLNGAGNEVYGLAKSLAVKPGDMVEAEVWAKYLDPSTTGTAGTAFAQLIQDLSNNVSSVVIDGATAGANPTIPFVGLIDHGSGASGVPKAYLTMLVFDLNYSLVNSAFKQIGASAEEDGTDVNHEYLSISPITIEEAGYVYIYLSNENGTPIEVFFDDFKVTHTNTDIVQKDDYYPFGLTFNSYTSGQENLYKYNGFEEQKEVGWYDYGARMYDPALARWHAVDPLADEYLSLTPYQYVMNNPIKYVDPDGMSTHVIDNGDGTYKVVGGDLEDDDRGIYIVTQNDDGSYSDPGDKIGESLTMFSFYNEDSQDGADQVGWKGTIDINSTESGDLVSEFMGEVSEIGLVEYMENAIDGKKYDFKRSGDEDNNDREYHHRGSEFYTKDDGTKVYASARDAGNFAAGYFAASKGLTWKGARTGFDGLEVLKSGLKGNFVSGEGRQSTHAQLMGYARQKYGMVVGPKKK